MIGGEWWGLGMAGFGVGCGCGCGNVHSQDNSVDNIFDSVVIEALGPQGGAVHVWG